MAILSVVLTFFIFGLGFIAGRIERGVSGTKPLSAADILKMLEQAS